MGEKGTVAAAASWGLGGGLAAWLLAQGPVAGVSTLQWALLAATPLLAALLVTLRALRPGGVAAGSGGSAGGEGSRDSLAFPWLRRAPWARLATPGETVREAGGRVEAAGEPQGALLRRLQAEMEELRRSVALEREAAAQPWSARQPPGAPAAPALGSPPAHPDDAAMRTLCHEMEEARHAALQELEAARQAREAAERNKGQAEAALRQAESIQTEALRFRREDQDALSKGVALFAQAQEARRRAAEELEAARRESQRLLEAAHGERQALEESLRHSMEEQKVALLREAYHARAQAEQQLENARTMAEEAASLRQTVQDGLEQVLRMRQDVDSLRRQALAILDQVSRGGSLPEPPPYEPTASGQPREGLPPPAGERPSTRGMDAAPPPPVGLEAGEGRESAQEGQRKADEAPPQGDFERQMADIARALEELARRSPAAPGQGTAGGPAPQERQPAPPPGRPPEGQEPARVRPPRPGAAPPPEKSGTLEEELAAILGRTSAGLEPSPPLDEPAAPARGRTARPASQGAAGAGAAAGLLSGQFHVTVRPMPRDESLGRFWTLLEKAVGIGNILAADPLADGSGMEFTVDVGREKVAPADLAGGIQDSQVVVEGTGRVVVILPPGW